MKPQSQGHAFGNDPHLQEYIKTDTPMESKHKSPSQSKDGDNMTYCDNKALKQLPQATSWKSWPNFSRLGEYYHMEIIDYIDGLFIYLPGIPAYLITARLNTDFKGHVSIWYTEMKEINEKTGHGGRFK
ncbi:hypothetical protein O181_046130 [Austropuccinia psidii MF-1]|uniref:Uncharacterized protein n=1 Tax=Austropuccinia psidii MF-1 TaxID=1389203 RepID=A0A9Q3DMX2_9BASI|nr:hypothetical protein [Austropuccinia psidii MF-1]